MKIVMMVEMETSMMNETLFEAAGVTNTSATTTTATAIATATMTTATARMRSREVTSCFTVC